MDCWKFCHTESMKIDINSDLGEGMGIDAQIMPFISSCNIACGGHAGDIQTMETTIDLAQKHQVKIGAHPSYPDRENFGRKPIAMDLGQLSNSLLEQIRTLESLVHKKRTTLHHIKPHGALYNEAAVNPKIAQLIIDLVKNHFPQCFLYVPDRSAIAQLAEKNHLKIMYEVFADRNYQDDLTLVSRQNPNAVFKDPKIVEEHLLRMVNERQVKTITGSLKPIKVDTICVHGDNPEALALSKTIFELFKNQMEHNPI